MSPAGMLVGNNTPEPRLPRTLSNADHPQELVNVIAGVANHAAENDEHVVDAQVLHDFVGARFVGGHGLADLIVAENERNGKRKKLGLREVSGG